MSGQTAYGPISRKVLEFLRRQSRAKVMDLAAIREGRKHAEDMHKERLDRIAQTGAKLPGHALYIYVQNLMADLSEMLTEMPGTEPFVELISKAEDEYMPSWPPMSPISKSFFISWTSFDLPIGKRRETIGTMVIDVAKEYGVHPDTIALMRVLSDSRMGVYQALEQKGDRVRLREITGGEPFTAEQTSGYQMRQAGELWYTRILPPPMPGAEHVLMTSPYVLLFPPLEAWMAYLDRALAMTPGLPREQAFGEHFKWGPNPRYWAEFVFEGYVNFESGAIYLKGMPDIASTRPCSPSYLRGN